MGADAVLFLEDLGRLLNDEAGVTWGLYERQRWLNLGQRTMCLWKPDSYVVCEWLTLAVGPRQVLPAGRLRPLDVIRNDPAHGGAVTLVERADLPANWVRTYAEDGIGVEHWMHTPADPRAIMIYPHYAAATSNKLEVVMQALAPDVDVYQGDDTATTSPEVQALSVEDTAALINFVLAFACLKQTDRAVRDRASFFLQQFLISIGKGREAALLANPQRILNVQGEQA